MLYLGVIGLLDISARAFFIYAYSNEAANKIGILEYIEIIFEGLFDSLVFGNMLTLEEFIAAVVVIAASFYVNLCVKKD